ncbi:MAG: LLM class F420-dependent oxidoreductase [Rhodospirillaceae bacterium]|nr:LLM class F420-dependent oxidoreductase [Rhodospirillaceae bacterium]MBT5675647.1 LLM class F420-dependent oxidoreductase [Rhodospirillaceae bacterium]MBT5780877.1 LLM class F420-dependent oxidoreductase [Rhodospirillaceae bacterium]
MRLGLFTGYSGPKFSIDMDMVLEAERLGFDSIWTSEAYGSDAVTPAAWILAQTSRINVGTGIIQMPARTPACAAMTAMTLQALSGGRFILGIGPSGPQVIEGWHGVAYGRPLTRTREYIDIIRQALKREAPVTHDGYHYQLPYKGADASGLGKPLKSILHGDPSMKIFTAAVAPAGIRLSAEIADGMFPIFMSPERFDVFADDLNSGFAKAGSGKSLADFEIAPIVPLAMGDDIEACRMPIRRHLALYIGGMGAPGKNFYNDYAKRLGFEEAAVKMQQLYLTGKKAEAEAAVPEELIDAIALVGPAARIKERLAVWKDAARQGKVSSLLLSGGSSVDALRFVAEEVL